VPSPEHDDHEHEDEHTESVDPVDAPISRVASTIQTTGTVPAPAPEVQAGWLAAGVPAVTGTLEAMTVAAPPPADVPIDGNTAAQYIETTNLIQKLEKEQVWPAWRFGRGWTRVGRTLWMHGKSSSHGAKGSAREPPAARGVHTRGA
jgi:hypothetical protein